MDLLLTNPTWVQIESSTEYLIEQAQKDLNTIDGIVALSRGGLVPGVIASHVTGARLFPITYSSKDGNGDNKDHNNHVPSFFEISNRPVSLVLIDDICDSGKTQLEVFNILSTLTPPYSTIRTVALYYKESAIFCPDYYNWTIPANGPDRVSVHVSVSKF